MRRYILLSLILCIVLISGCVEQPEEKAKQLADGTAEGSMATVLAQSIAKIEDCTIGELISKLNVIYANEGMDKLEPSGEEKATMESFLESAKTCPQRIEKGVSKISESKYLVSYSFIASSNCQKPAQSLGDENFLQIEVNIATETTKVVKGAFDEKQKQTVQTQIQNIKDMGNCGALLMMGTVSSSPAPVA